MSNLTTYKTWFRVSIINRVLGFIVAALNTFFACLPVDTASTFGGWMARRVGPKLRVTKNARRELNIVFPDLKNEEIELIIIQMWDNLGRTAAEHPHLAKFNPYQKNGRVEIEGAEYIDQLREDNKPGIFFSGHLANWELVPLASTKRDLPLHLIYRKANNLFFDRLVQKGRLDTGGKYFPKGPAGSKDILKVLNSGDHLAMLIDQKMNDGISVPFMGRNAMTAPALGQLARKYDCPVVPVQVSRIKGAYFKITVHPPIKIEITDDKNLDIHNFMTNINSIVADWIKENPEQWLWVHNRWPNVQETLLK